MLRPKHLGVSEDKMPLNGAYFLNLFITETLKNDIKGFQRSY
jgi:hypothetical protein